MSTINVEVKYGGEVVSNIEIEQFETVDAAVATLGDAVVLGLINRQHKADEANKERAKFRPDTKSKKAIRQRAIELCLGDDVEGGLNDQMTEAVQKGLDNLYAFLDKVAEDHGLAA